MGVIYLVIISQASSIKFRVEKSDSQGLLGCKGDPECLE